MNRLIVFTLTLALTLSLAVGGNRADASQNTGDKPFVGMWQAVNTVTGELDARYALYGDGTFIYGSSEIVERELYKAGTWSIANDELRLAVESRWVLPVGNIEDIVPNDELIILGGGLIKLICNPPEIETYRIVQTGVKPETDRDTIAIDGVTFYDFNEQTDLFDGFYALPIN
ncbi:MULTISPECIES: hypothetical protein [Sporomusa]|uniref:hypothetical protein n=1 Tax=Sporomusa TaxID=2375 RepID=UPI00166DF924|nr:hypothetical protein [Sporomusa sp. GT1]